MSLGQQPARKDAATSTISQPITKPMPQAFLIKTRLIAFVLHPRDAKEVAIPEQNKE